MGWVFGLGAAVATTHWIGIALWHQPDMPRGVGLGASVIAWVYSAWPWGLLGMLGAAWQRWRPVSTPSPGVRVLRLGVLAPAVVLAWWSQSWWLSGFPWLVPAPVWLDTPLQGWAPVGGGLLVAALGLGLAISVALAWDVAGQTGAPQSPDHTARLWVWGGVALTWAVVFGGGIALQTVQWTQPAGTPVRVGVVQVNKPNMLGQDIAQEHAYQRMAWRITGALAERHQPDVIVWPEALVTSSEQPLREWLTRHSGLLQQRALVIGAVIEDTPASGEASSRKVTNSLLAYGVTGSGRYDKRELVPMTERWPDSGPWPMLAAWANAQPWVQPGAALQAPLKLAEQTVGASICYEDAFPHIYQDLPASVGWLINSSNDGWFARTPVMPAQHLALSRLRALEQQKPLVRAANIGPSAILDAWGHPMAQTITGQPQMLYADVQPRQGHTPYARWGHAWLWVTGPLTLLALGRRHRSLRP